MIDRDTLEIKILGPKNDKGYYREKAVVLHCVRTYEEVKPEAFEYLRKNLIGKKIQFMSYVLADKKVAADIFVDKKLITYDYIA